MSSETNGSIFPTSGTETNSSNDNNKCGLFELQFLSHPHSNHNSSYTNPTLSYLNSLNCWSQKTFPSTSQSTNFMPTTYLDEQLKLQQLQMQLLQLEQNGKDQQNTTTKEHSNIGSKVGCLNSTSVNAPDVNVLSCLQNTHLWNNLRMLDHNNPSLRVDSPYQNTSEALSLQDIQHLAFLNQIYSQVDIGQSQPFSPTTGFHPNVESAEVHGSRNHSTSMASLQGIPSTGSSSEQNQTVNFANNENAFLAGQLFSNLCALHNDSQKQREAISFFRDSLSESLRYTNLLSNNGTTHPVNEFLSSSGSSNTLLPNTSIPESNNTTTTGDTVNNSFGNSLAYSQALMMVMNAMYSNYKTIQTPDQSPSTLPTQNDLTTSNGLNLIQRGSINYPSQQPISTTSTPPICPNVEPKESFSDVLTFLSKCLNKPTNRYDKRQTNLFTNQQPPVTSSIGTKPPSTTNPKLSGRQKAGNSNHQINQCNSSTTPHRGRGRPPKLAGVQCQMTSKQQTQTKQSHSVNNTSEKQLQVNTQAVVGVSPGVKPNIDQNCTQSKAEISASSSKIKPFTCNSVTGESREPLDFSVAEIKNDLMKSQEQKSFEAINGRNEGSIEETIDEVLKNIDNCNGDLVNLANRLAYTALGIRPDEGYRRENSEVVRSSQSSANMPTHLEFTSSAKNSEMLQCAKHSNLQTPIPSNSNVGHHGTLEKVAHLDPHRRGVCASNNPHDRVPEISIDCFSQTFLSESKYAKSCASSTPCSMNTFIDPKGLKSTYGVDLPSVCSTKKQNNNSSINASHHSFTLSNSSSLQPDQQMNMPPSHSCQVFSKENVCTSTTDNRGSHLHHQLANEQTINSSYPNDIWSTPIPNISNSVQQQQQNLLEKEYLKTFFIEFVKQQEAMEKEKADLIIKEKKQLQEKKILELIEQELRKPVEDLRLIDLKPLPQLNSIPGNKMSGKMFGNCLMVVEFLHAFKDILCLDTEAIPNLGELQSALIDRDIQCQRVLVHLLIELLRLAICDPGLPNSRLVTQLLGQRLNETELDEHNVSGVLRAFIIGRNGYEDDMSNWLHPPTQFIQLPGDRQAALLAFICDELICSSRLISTEVDRNIEQQLLLKREKLTIESRIRRLRLLIAQKSITPGTSTLEYERGGVGKSNSISSDSYGGMKPTQTSYSEIGQASLKYFPKPPTRCSPEVESVGADQKIQKHDATMKQIDLDDEVAIHSNTDSKVSMNEGTLTEQPTCEKISSIKSNISVPFSTPPIVASGVLIEDEDDMCCKISELEAKLETLISMLEQKQKEVDEASTRLSGLFLGQDRYYRNYYSLKHMGGIYIECEPFGRIQSGSECYSNSLQTKMDENFVEDNWSDLPDSHPDYIVGQIKARHALAAQQHQLKLTGCITSTHQYSQAHSLQCANRSSLNVENVQQTEKSCTNNSHEIEQSDSNSETVLKHAQITDCDNSKSASESESEDKEVNAESLNNTDEVMFDVKNVVKPSNECDNSTKNTTQDDSSISPCLSSNDYFTSVTSEIRTIDSEVEKSLPNKEDPDIIQAKFPAAQEACDVLHQNDANFQSTVSPINENDEHLESSYECGLQNVSAMKSNDQENQESDIKPVLSTEVISNSSEDITEANKIDNTKGEKELGAKIPTVKYNVESVTDMKSKSVCDAKPSIKHQQEQEMVYSSELLVGNTISHQKVSEEDQYGNPKGLVNFTVEDKALSSTQPLDLSNKSFRSKQLTSESINTETQFITEINHTCLPGELDDSTLTKSIILFMNYTGIMPATVNNQICSDTWIYVMNYCKLLLSSALSDELECAKNKNSDQTAYLNSPLTEAVMKIKRLIPDEIKNEPADNTEKITSDGENIHSPTGDSLPDIDTSDYVNKELEVRRIQTVTEDLSCIKSKSESTWFQLVDRNKLKEFLNALTLRGVREKQLGKCIRRSKDFIELSMQLALKQNSEYNFDKHIPIAKLNARLFRIRLHRRRRKRGIGSVNNRIVGRNWDCFSGNGSNCSISTASWETNNSHDMKETECPHSTLPCSDAMCSSDECSSESNCGLTVYSRRSAMDACHMYCNYPAKSPLDPADVTTFKYKGADDKRRKKEDAFADKHCIFMGECQLLHEVEALEDRVLYANLQIKGWKPPTKTSEDQTISLIPRSAAVKKSRFEYSPLDLARNRLLDIEQHLERRYLVPPLNTEIQLDIVPEADTNEVVSSSNRSDSVTESVDILIETEDDCNDAKFNKGVSNNGVSEEDSNISKPHHLPQIRRVINKQPDLNDENDSSTNHKTQTPTNQPSDLNLISNSPNDKSLPPGLIRWRSKLSQAFDVTTVRRCMEELVQAIAWDKSIMKVLCQICRRDNNEACLLLCDGCDRGYHTYCFRPQLSNIPSGDWFCYDCVSKATSKRLCYICGGCDEVNNTIQSTDNHSPSNNNIKRMAICYHCSRAVHNTCARPTFVRIPKKWYCSNCIFLKYSKSNNENSDISVEKSRRKRKEYGDAIEETDTNSNQRVKKRKMYSRNSTTFDASEETALGIFGTSSQINTGPQNQSRNRKHRGWWKKIHKYGKHNDTLNSVNIPIPTTSKVLKYRSRHQRDIEDKSLKTLNYHRGITDCLLSRKRGRKPNYHSSALPTKSKRHYHRRSALLIPKTSGYQENRRRHCSSSSPSSCDNSTNNDGNFLNTNLDESRPSTNQITHQMTSNELEWCRVYFLYRKTVKRII
uniref:Uncharacterized protein n=1 Tax=Trichobilharzia regenti TaxID=157069 RepID=A0AA85ITD1_TRIRE|nr:unnamed protein product [Trichobilharzia regenti]